MNVIVYYGVPIVGLLAALILVFQVAAAIRRDWLRATRGSDLLPVIDDHETAR